MKGFLRRDFSLIVPSLRFYGLLLVIMFAFFLFTRSDSTFLMAYLYILAQSVVISLFNYDEQGRWQAYASAAGGGRQNQVRGRYAFILLLNGVIAFLQYILCLVNHTPYLPTLSFAGVCLFILAILIPLCYKFGANKTRIFTVVFVGLAAAISGGAVAYSSALEESSLEVTRTLSLVALPALAVGLGALVISYGVSQKILDKKEF